MAAALSARCSTAVRNELPMPLANCRLTACRTGRPSSAASVASCSLPSTTRTSSKPAAQTCRTARRTSGSPPNGKRSFCVPIRVEAPAASTTALTMSEVSVVGIDRFVAVVDSRLLRITFATPAWPSPRAALPRQEVGDVIPAAFDYLRAHTTDEAFAHLQQHGAEARVLAGGQSLIPAMRFRLARPAVLVDINSLNDLSYLRIERSGAGGRRDRARQRHRARAVDRRAPLEPHPRRVARGRRSGRAPDGHGRRQPVPQRSRRRLDGGRARLSRHRRRSRQGRNRAASRSTSSSSTASRPPSGKARWRSARSFRCPTIAPPVRTRRSSARSATSPPPRRPCRCR